MGARWYKSALSGEEQGVLINEGILHAGVVLDECPIYPCIRYSLPVIDSCHEARTPLPYSFILACDYDIQI